MNELVIEKIQKKFKSRVVVNQVSFAVKSGQIVGLLGPNGAGKTTSFYIAVGLIRPDSGQVFLNQKSVSHLPMYQRARLGLSYLPQEPSVFRRLTVKENLLIALEAHGWSSVEKSEKLEELLEDFKIQHIRGSYGYSLSGGERRRVEISRALGGDPKFLLLDEPFAGIDPIAVQDIQDIIVGLKSRGIGVLITDHNVRETLRICDHAYILKDGRIEVEGSALEIAASPVARRFYLGENFSL